MRDDEVLSVRGDGDDVFSRGFLCPKSQGLKQLHEDPDLLQRPLVRRDGELVEASWEEAFEAVAEGLGRVLDEGGRDAVAVYLGNPSAHSLGPTLYSASNASLLRTAPGGDAYSAPRTGVSLAISARADRPEGLTAITGARIITMAGADGGVIAVFQRR